MTDQRKIEEAKRILEGLAQAEVFHDGHRAKLTRAYKPLLEAGKTPEEAVMTWAQALKRRKGAA